MKNTLIIVLAFSLLFAFAGCKEHNISGTTEELTFSATESTETIATEPMVDYTNRITIVDNVIEANVYGETVFNTFPIIELDGERSNNMNSIVSDYCTYCCDYGYNYRYGDESKYFSRFDRYYDVITYRYSICGEILSIIMCKHTFKLHTTFDIFNFYIPGDRLADEAEIAAAFGLSVDEAFAESSDAIYNYYMTFGDELWLSQVSMYGDDINEARDRYADYFEEYGENMYSGALKEGVSHEDLYKHAAELSLRHPGEPRLTVFNGNLCVVYAIDGYFDDGDGVEFRECIFPYNFSNETFIETDVLNFNTGLPDGF